MSKYWELREYAEVLTDTVRPGIEVHPLVLSILSARGCRTSDAVSSFLNPSLSDMLDPFLLRGMDAAVTRLLDARRNKEMICIYGDYDIIA
jgi:single-stranded-DNA-specific exonuclease